MLKLRCLEIDDPRRLEEIFALRYAVYVNEMGRPQPDADHERQRVFGPLDRSAHHLAAYGALEGAAAESERDGQLLGALRMHVVGEADLSTLYTVHPSLGSHDGSRRGVVTRLVTHPCARGGGTDSAGLQLSLEAYRMALRHELDVVHIDCHADLAPFFEWLGFDTDRRFEHPDFGPIAIMRIRIRDRARLARTNSPLAAILDEESAGARRSARSRPASGSHIATG